MAAINEMVTKFSFLGSLKPQENFNSNLKASLGLMAGMSAAIVGATGAFVAWTTNVTQAIDPMVQLSRETNVSIAAIQELGFAASQNGSNVDDVMSSISELTKRAGEFARTGGGTASEAFLQLGVSVVDANGKMKTADALMMDLQGRMQGFSKAEQADLLDKLGINPSMIQLMNQSTAAVSALREKAKALGTITKEQADAAASLNDSNTTLRFGYQGLQNQIATGFAPVLQSITEETIGFLMANKDLIQNGIKSLGQGLLAATGFIQRMTPVVLGAAAAFGVWKIANIGVAASLGLIFTPVTLIIAGIAAAALVVDDLIVAFNGGSSAIRNLIMEWTGFDILPGLKSAVAAVKDFTSFAIGELTKMKDIVFSLFSGVSDIWLGDFSGGFDKILGAASAAADLIKEYFGVLFSYIPNQLANILPDFLTDAMLDDSQSQGFRGGANGAVNNGITNNSASNANVTMNNNYKIYSTDPQQAGASVYSYQPKQLQETKQYYKRGGM